MDLLHACKDKYEGDVISLKYCCDDIGMCGYLLGCQLQDSEGDEPSNIVQYIDQQLIFKFCFLCVVLSMWNCGHGKGRFDEMYVEVLGEVDIA